MYNSLLFFALSQHMPDIKLNKTHIWLAAFFTWALFSNQYFIRMDGGCANIKWRAHTTRAKNYTTYNCSIKIKRTTHALHAFFNYILNTFVPASKNDAITRTHTHSFLCAVAILHAKLKLAQFNFAHCFSISNIRIDLLISDSNSVGTAPIKTFIFVFFILFRIHKFLAFCIALKKSQIKGK